MDSFTWAGSLLNSGDTDADDISSPARPASRHRTLVPYLALFLVRPGEMSLGDKLAASIGLVPGWTSCQSILTGTFAGFALGPEVSQDAEARADWRARAILLV